MANALTPNRPAVARAARALQPILGQLADRELDLLTTHLRQALAGRQTTEPQEALVRALADEHTFSAGERISLEMESLLAYFLRRGELLEGALTAPQVAKLLGTSRQTPHDRAKHGALVAVLDRGALRFPAWQFDSTGADGVLPGLPTVLRALHVSPLAKVIWMVRPNPYLDGETPLAILKRGDVDRVAALARTVEAD